MTKKTDLLQRSIETLRHYGLTGLLRKAALYLARRIAWRSDAWSKSLDLKISRDYLLREYGSLIKRNEIFRDRHKGQRCFVIGNGPSLKDQDLSPLTNEITLVTNSFYRHPIVGGSWQPTYYFLSDPQYFDGSVGLTEFSSITSHIRSAPFFVPYHGRDYLVRTRALPEERTYYVAAYEGIAEGNSKKPDFTKATPGVQTVVQLAIMSAMYMGCSPIYLLGLDHDWLAHGGDHLNFYSEQAANSQPDGNLPGWTYHSMLDAVLTMWKIYEFLLRVAESEGIKIINATQGGFLDVFDRQSYESIIAKRDRTEDPA